MNKIFNINLGGYPFTIDEDAYDHLNAYLKTIHRHFNQSEGYEEITHDIEARLAELFLEQLNNRPIVAFQNVEDAIAIMGRPEEFGDACAFLCSAQAGFISGQNLQMDGGSYAGLI